MIDPYRMVFVNVIASFLLLSGTIFYRYVYPKKKINLFTLLLFISILPIISILRTGDYESGDFNIHIYRIMVFYDSLLEGNFMPSWAGELNATYGNPLFIFNYSLSYYIVSFLHFIGFSFISSLKIFLGASFFFSGIFMYLWIKKLTENNLAAFASSIFYLFNPYHLIDVHFRATPGESSIFTLAPLVFLFVTLYFKEKKFHYLIPISFLTLLLSLGHPLQALAILAIVVLYVIFIGRFNKDITAISSSVAALFIGGVASMYLWLPFVLYAPYTFVRSSDPISFPPFNLLFFSPWRYGFLFQGPKGELALMIGYAQIFILLASIFMLIRGKVLKKIRIYYLFWLIMFIILLFLMHPSSKIIWDFFLVPGRMLIPFGRLLLPMALCTSVIAGYFVVAFSNTKAKRKFIYILLIITVGSTILNWGHRRVIPEIDDSVLRKNVWISTISEGPVYFLNNKWADPNNLWFSELPNEHLEIIKGKGTINEIKRTSTKHSYLLNAQTPVLIRENTLYYPGWNLKSNDRDIFIFPGERGIINAKLPSGIQHVELTYEDISYYKMAKIISLSIFITLLTLLTYILLIRRFLSPYRH